VLKVIRRALHRFRLDSMAPIVNPYAKKSKPQAPSTSSNASTNVPPSVSTAPAPAIEPPTEFSSFSQAFPTQPATSTTESRFQTTNLPTELTDRECQSWLDSQTHLYVSPKQRGNGVLEFIRNVPMREARMTPDYVWNATNCALFLSCQYHALHPHYLERRLAEVGSDYQLRILLVLVDQSDPTAVLFCLNTTAVRHNWTLVLAWSEREAARYLESYKALHGRDASSIQKRKATEYTAQVVDLWTTCVNTTDAGQLQGHFGSVANVVQATPDEWAAVPGLGPVKLKKMVRALHMPFGGEFGRQRKVARAKLQQQADRVDEEP